MIDFAKANPVTDPDFRRQWREGRERCYICGKHHRDAWPPHQVHHIIKPGRSDEPTNLFFVCARCHDVIEGHRVSRSKGTYWPPIPLAAVLHAKQQNDPDEYDPERLMRLWHRVSLPDLEPPDSVYEMEKANNIPTPWGFSRSN